MGTDASRILDWRPGRRDEVPECLYDPLRRRTRLPIADRPAIELDDGADLCRRPRDERLVGGPDVVEGEEPFLRLQAQLRRDFEDRLPRHTWEVRRRERSRDGRVADDEEVVRS